MSETNEALAALIASLESNLSPGAYVVPGFDCHKTLQILRALASSPKGAALPQGVWQPIDTAPKDGAKFIAFCPRLGICAPAEWDDNRFAKRPRPYWTHWGERIWGINWIRDDQPTHWMPLPQPPQESA